MTKPSKRLGRGLSSLISADISEKEAGQPRSLPGVDAGYAAASSRHRVLLLAVDRIRPNPSQPRKLFEERSLNALADSIRERGTLQPIVVRSSGTGYEVIAGERRLRAATIAGLAEMPAIVRSVSDDEMLELALIENIQRADLNAIERARGYQVLHERYGLSHEQVAARMGEDRATVSNYIRLLGLCEEAVQAIARGDLGPGHGKVLLGQSDPKAQCDLARRAIQEHWSVRQLEVSIRSMRPSAPNPKPRSVRPAVSDMEQRLSAAAGTRVSIREGRRRHTGKILIEYSCLDDFERIMTLMGVPVQTEP